MVSRKRYLELESQAEIAAVVELGSTSAPDILRMNGIGETHPSYEEKKNRKGQVTKTTLVNVRGQDVFAVNTWNAFLAFKSYGSSSLISLTDDTDRLIEEYYTFLTTSYTDRYRNLDMEGKTWLRQVIRLAVKYHLMKNKFTHHVQALRDGTYDEDYMCSEFAPFCWQLIQVAKLSNGEVAREVHHILKEPEKEKYFIQRFFDEHYKRMHEELKKINFPEQDTVLRMIKPGEEEAV